jgi:hypothetical protein
MDELVGKRGTGGDHPLSRGRYAFIISNASNCSTCLKLLNEARAEEEHGGHHVNYDKVKKHIQSAHEAEAKDWMWRNYDSYH